MGFLQYSVTILTARQEENSVPGEKADVLPKIMVRYRDRPLQSDAISPVD